MKNGQSIWTFCLLKSTRKCFNYKFYLFLLERKTITARTHAAKKKPKKHVLECKTHFNLLGFPLSIRILYSEKDMNKKALVLLERIVSTKMMKLEE